MGNNNSLLAQSGFTKSELSRLEKRFKKLDSDSSGALSVAEFLTIPELKSVWVKWRHHVLKFHALSLLLSSD